MTDELVQLKKALQEQISQTKQTEARLSGVLESTPDAVVIIDSEHKITLVNTQSVTLFGYTRTELLDQPLVLIIPERFRASYIAHLHHSTIEGEFELYARRKDGSEFPVEVKVSTFETEDGTLIANYIRDITKRVKIVEALAEERRLFHALMDNIPDLIYFKDIDSRFTRINRAHALMLGAKDPKDALGKRDPDFQDPEISKGFLAEEVQIISTGQPVVNREEFNPAPDGTPRWFSISKVPIKDSYGNITGIVGISHDITRRKQTEEALLNSEEQFHNTFIYAPIGMALVGIDGRWLLVNRAVCEIVGYTELELFSKRFQDITHPDDLHTDLQYVDQLLGGEIQSYQMEKRYFHKQGHEVWVLLSVSLVRDSAGIPLHFISQIQDITERKRTEAALKAQLEAEHEFQTYLKALHEITIQLMNINDLDEFYKYAVEQGLQRLGFDRIGLFLYDPKNSLAIGTYGTDPQGNLVAEHHLRFDPSDPTNILMQALQAEQHFFVAEETPLFSNLKPISRGWNAAAVLWNGAEILGWLTIDNGVQHLPMTKPLLDMLALYALTLGALLTQKRTQVALSEQRNLLRTLIDNLPDYIYIKNLKSQFVLVNQAMMDRSTIGDMIGKSDFDSQPREVAQAFFDEEQALFQSGQAIINKEQWILGPQGETVYYLTTKIPLRDSQGQIIGLLGAGRDITERRQLQSVLIDKEKLQAALDKELELSRLKSRMMERISHEFRTPLTVIQLTTETFMNYFDRLKPEQRVQKATTIQQATGRLTHMLDRISNVIKEGLEVESLHLFPFNLRYVIDSCTYELEQQLHRSEKYVLDLPNTIMVLADRDVIKDALFPILQNAAYYSPPDSPVIVQLVPVESGIELQISDKGIGILPNELSRIFDPFFRGSNINEIGGLGIGLTIAARSVAAHKGTIKVESTVGKGTTVKVWLPN